MIDTFLDFAMENARNDVAHHRGVLLNAVIIDSEGKYDLVGATNLQTDKAKSAWFAELRRLARERRAQAVIITAPVSRAVYSVEGGKKFKQLEAAGISLRIDDAVKLGLCEKKDAILVSMQTPLQSIVYTQDYEYVNGQCVFGETMRTGSNEGAQFNGPFTNFFDELPPSKPS